MKLQLQVTPKIEKIAKELKIKQSEIVGILRKMVEDNISNILPYMNENLQLDFDDNGNTYVVTRNKYILIGNIKTELKKYKIIMTKPKIFVDESRFEPIDSDVEVIEEDAEIIDSDVEVIEKDVEVIEDEYIGERKLAKIFPHLYEHKAYYDDEKYIEKQRLISEISRIYPKHYRTYAQEINILVHFGIIKQIPKTPIELEKYALKLRELMKLYPRSWKKHLKTIFSND